MLLECLWGAILFKYITQLTLNSPNYSHFADGKTEEHERDLPEVTQLVNAKTQVVWRQSTHGQFPLLLQSALSL